MSFLLNINSAFLFLSLASFSFLGGCGAERAQSPAVAQVTVQSPKSQDLSALLKRGDAGDVDAQFYLGWRYAKGECVSQDSAKSVEWFNKAAAQGDAPAKFNLGLAYDNGEGVPKNNAKAVALYQEAAILAVPRAQHNLGLKYLFGNGVPGDRVLAYVWFKLAAISTVERVENAVKAIRLVGYLLSKDELAEAQRLASGWKIGQAIVREGVHPRSPNVAVGANE